MFALIRLHLVMCSGHSPSRPIRFLWHGLGLGSGPKGDVKLCSMPGLLFRHSCSHVCCLHISEQIGNVTFHRKVVDRCQRWEDVKAWGEKAVGVCCTVPFPATVSHDKVARALGIICATIGHNADSPCLVNCQFDNGAPNSEFRGTLAVSLSLSSVCGVPWRGMSGSQGLRCSVPLRKHRASCEVERQNCCCVG